MRGTWIILLIMIIAGVGMYFYFGKKEKKAVDHDSIAFENTPDSIVKKIKVYVAQRPLEVMYLDSVWMQQDSTPLKQVAEGNVENRLEKLDSSVNLYVSYDNKYFYDLELKKINPKYAYRLNLQVRPQNNDTMIVDGTIEPQKGDIIAFQDVMMKVYPKFVITYNDRLPEEPVDSNKIEGHKPAKTVTVLQQNQ
jgi:hypothetical protein